MEFRGIGFGVVTGSDGPSCSDTRVPAGVRNGLWALSLAAVSACSGTAAALGRMEREARQHPRPELDKVIASHQDLVPALGPLRERTLDLQPGLLPVVAASVNGRPCRALLDTGTSMMAMDAEFGEQAGLYLDLQKKIGAIHPGRTLELRLGAAEEIELGGMRFGPAVTGLPSTEEGAASMFGPKRRYAAIVGNSVLSHFRVRFDFRRRVVRLTPHGRDSPGRGVLLVRAQAGKHEVRLLVDSGAHGLFLNPETAVRLGLLDRATPQVGRARRLARRLPLLTVANRRFYNVPVSVITLVHDDVPKHIVAEFAQPDGLLGLSGFGPLVWTIDYGSRKISVAPR